MAKARTSYVCDACGAASPSWRGQCPGCQAWNTLSEQTRSPAKPRGTAVPAAANRPQSLAGVQGEEGRRLTTGMPELDALLGGGLAPGGALLVAGEPGVGKSTLLLQLAGGAARSGARVLYASGEESAARLKSRAERLGLSARELESLGERLAVLASCEAADVLDVLGAMEPPGLVIVDSVQTLRAPMVDGGAGGTAGSPSQVRAVAALLQEAARDAGAALVLVGHVTKEGAIAGPKLLEHMVDTVVFLESTDDGGRHRLLRVIKNRYGPAQELAVLCMGEGGLTAVADPSQVFLEARDPSLSGTALALAQEGSKAFALEVQALTAASHLVQPRRVAVGFDLGRLQLLLAVMEKRLGLELGATDVYVKVGGGLRIGDPGLDLAVVAAVMGSHLDRALPEHAAFFGEVDLNGLIRPVAGMDRRRTQAARLGLACVPFGMEGAGAQRCDRVMDGLFA